MAIDKEKYIGKYVDEGLELIAQIEGLVLDIRDGISIEDDLATLLRALHTLKGSSRMLEFKRIEELSHTLESVFIALKDQRLNFTDNAVKLCLSALDAIKGGLGIIQRTKDDDIEIEGFVKKLVLLAENEEFTLPEADATQALTKVVQEPPVLEVSALSSALDQTVNEGSAKSIQNEEFAELIPIVEGAIRPSNEKTNTEVKSDSIRLSIEKIDDIIRSIASMQSLEITARTISLDSIALNSLIKEHIAKLKADKNSDPSLVINFRKLERLSEHINSSLKNYSMDASNYIKGAYDTVISLRTLPLSTVLDSYPRYVFQLSDDLGKKVQLTMEGKDNEIDKNIIESLSDVFMHIVRNSIDHGIESPQERIVAGKTENGHLSIVCSRESGSMKIIISDDGRGIDHEKIRQKAVRDGYYTEASVASLSREEVTNLIFQRGFSTSSEVSNISGRGVGLDVVRETVESLKGSIAVDSVFGKGTAFTIIVPLSIAALVGFPIVTAGMKFIFPATFVDTILLINSNDIITVVDRPEIQFNDRLIKLYYLNQVLQIKATVGIPADLIFVVIVRAYDDIMALAVDDIASMRSVILKTMPGFMEDMPVFSGMVLNEEYEMISVLHIPTVIKMAKNIKPIDLKKRNVEFEKLRKRILVVDDSRATSEIESEILSSEGYLVDTAADGADALRAVKNKQYDLICTDIKMPIMDGFMLIENIKKNEELTRIPIIVISSMANEEDQIRAELLGASRYIIKNSFNNYNLLEAVRDLIGGTNE